MSVAGGRRCDARAGLVEVPGGDPGGWTLTPRQLTQSVELAVVAFGQLQQRLCLGGMGSTPDEVANQFWEHNVGRRPTGRPTSTGLTFRRSESTGRNQSPITLRQRHRDPRRDPRAVGIGASHRSPLPSCRWPATCRTSMTE